MGFKITQITTQAQQRRRGELTTVEIKTKTKTKDEKRERNRKRRKIKTNKRDSGRRPDFKPVLGHLNNYLINCLINI